MKPILQTLLCFLFSYPVVACMELTEITEENFEDIMHPFQLERQEGFLLVTILKELPGGCGVLRRSNIGTENEILNDFEFEQTELGHEYFVFEHQIKRHDLRIAGFFDCAKCGGVKQVYVFKLGKQISANERGEVIGNRRSDTSL
ncbi:hypothetical protein MLD52_21605 [Puniceicoccaceae bacterium K14]|nr:hypothetical protein [Puniceicoccaceae bacterium K14]